jgi:ATP-binding cassette, subfamily B, bacterial
MHIPLNRYRNLLINYLRPQRMRVILLTFFLFSSIGLQLANPQIIRYYIDTAVSGGSLTLLVRGALLFIGIAILQQVITIFVMYFSETVGWTATNLLRMDLATHCLNLDLSFHNAHTPGEIIERIDGDVNKLSNFLSRFVIDMLGNSLLLISVLILLFLEDWRIGLALTIFALATLVILTRIRHIAVPYWNKVREINAQFFGFLGEYIAGTEDIRSNGAVNQVMRRFYMLLREWLPMQIKSNLAGYTMWSTTLVVFALGDVLAFGFGAYLWSTGAITIGTVYIIVYYTTLLANPIEQVRTQIQDLQQADASIARVEELLQVKSKLQDGPGTPISDGAPSVDFKNVSFGYNLESAILHDVTFHLEPGKVLGLLGHTGSGKTSLARLIFRLYDPQAGEICLGQVPLQMAHIADLRHHVGIATQNVELFHATVRDNLTFFNRLIADERILAVLKDLGLWEWFSSLPSGLDSELESTTSLSAGEAQLLAFARLFLNEPKLVILDEASSRLDPVTEKLLEHAVDKLLQGRTGIIIAHRLATIQRVDQILILEQGHVLEYGQRDLLAGDPTSHFSKLLRTGIEEVLV